jgi:fibronectin-binding autotransporter adhesin
MTSGKLNRRVLSAVALAVVSGASVASAATYTWNTVTTGPNAWSNGSNWAGLAAPAGTDPTDALIFTGVFSGTNNSVITTTNNDLSANPFLLNSLELGGSLNSSVGTGAWFALAMTSTNPLRFSGSPALTLSGNDNGTRRMEWRVASPIQLDANLAVGGNGTASGQFDGVGFTLSGVLSNATASATGITKSGTSRLRLSGGAANTFTGGIIINGGQIALSKTGNAAALGAGTITVNNTGSLLLLDNNNLNTTHSVIVNTGGTFTQNNKTVTMGKLSALGGTVSGSGAATFEVQGGFEMTGGSISTTGSIRFATTQSFVTNQASASAVFGGTGNLLLWNGNTTKTFNIADGAAAVDFRIDANVINDGSNAITITKTGAGVMEFNRAAGTGLVVQNVVNVNAGELRLSNTSGSATGAVTTINVSGTGRVGGNGITTSGVTIASGAAGRITPGTSIGTLTTGAVNIPTTGFLDVELGTPNAVPISGISDRLIVNGNLAVNGNINLINNANANAQGSLAAGSYRIATYTGTFAGTPAVTGPASHAYSLATVSNVVDLTAYDHSNGSFAATDTNTLNIDFGTVAQNSVASQNFDLYNVLNTPSLTLGLDIDSVGEVDLSNKFATSLVAISNILAAGANATYSVTFDTTTPGTFNAVYTIGLSDASGLATFGLSAAGSETLTLNVTGIVAEVPEPTTLMLVPLAGLITLRRRTVR